MGTSPYSGKPIANQITAYPGAHVTSPFVIRGARARSPTPTARCPGLLVSHRGEVVQKLRKRLTVREIVQQRPDGHSGANEHSVPPSISGSLWMTLCSTEIAYQLVARTPHELGAV